QSAVDAPVILDKTIVNGLSKILVGIPECDRARAGYPKQKISEVRAGDSSSELELAARILLSNRIELLPPHVCSELDVVPAVSPEAVVGDGARLIFNRRILPV